MSHVETALRKRCGKERESAHKAMLMDMPGSQTTPTLTRQTDATHLTDGLFLSFLSFLSLLNELLRVHMIHSSRM